MLLKYINKDADFCFGSRAVAQNAVEEVCKISGS